MKRKVLAPFAVVAVVAAGGAFAHPAHAAPPRVDVSNDSITCRTVLEATASIDPPLSFAGTATSVTVKIKGKLAGCVDDTNPSVLIRSGSVSGTLSGVTNDCAALAGAQPLTGTLVYRWKADPTTPILQTSSAQAVAAVTGALFHPGVAAPAFGAAAYGSFSLDTASVSGAFTGGDGGASSTNIALTSEDLSVFTALCTPPAAGIKTLHFGLAKFTLS